MTFEEIWKREGWFSEDTSEYELAKACYKAGEDEARAAVAAELRELRAKLYPQLFWHDGTYQKAMAEVDATIAKLGLGGTED